MPKFECSGTRLIDDEIEAADEREAANAFRQKHGVYPSSVGDRDVVGSCEVSGKVILDGDAYVVDADGVRILDEFVGGLR